MSSLTDQEIDQIHSAIDLEIAEKGIPTDAELQQEIEQMNKTARKTPFQESLGV